MTPEVRTTNVSARKHENCETKPVFSFASIDYANKIRLPGGETREVGALRRLRGLEQFEIEDHLLLIGDWFTVGGLARVWERTAGFRPAFARLGYVSLGKACSLRHSYALNGEKKLTHQRRSSHAGRGSLTGDRPGTDT